LAQPDGSGHEAIYAAAGVRLTVDGPSELYAPVSRTVRRVLTDPVVARRLDVVPERQADEAPVKGDTQVLGRLVDPEWVKKEIAKQRLTAEPGSIEWLNQLGNVKNLSAGTLTLRNLSNNLNDMFGYQEGDGVN